MKFSEAGTEAACFALFREQWDPQVIARFTVDGEPVSKARARFTSYRSTTRAYTPERTYEAEQLVAWKFRQAARNHRPDPDETYGVMALFFSGTRQRRDVDNMLKLILDGLTGVAWRDDEQVVEISGRKSFEEHHPDHARTEVVVYRVGQVHRPTAICEYCGQSYDTYASWKKGQRRFCSLECNYAWRRDRRTRTCAQCGGEFVGHHVTHPAKFCSRECADEARRAKVTCDGCGVEFTKQRCHVRARNYCSTRCREAHWVKARKAAAKGVCETCGGPTSKKTYRQCRTCHLAGAPVSGKPKGITELPEVTRGD